jgi:hypothetical protein
VRRRSTSEDNFDIGEAASLHHWRYTSKQKQNVRARNLDFRSQNTCSLALESLLDTSTKGDFAIEKIAMTSEKADCSRRSYMSRVAAEAPTILASETDHIQNSIWPYKSAFLRDYPTFSNDGRPWKVDDQNIDLMALIVVDDFPVEVCTSHGLDFHFQKPEADQP